MTVTGLIFMFFFLLGLFMALVRNPMYGLITYIGVFYLHPPSRWWGHFLPDLRWSLVSAAVMLIAALRYKSTVVRPAWYSTTPAKLLIIYALWLWIQLPWALNVEQQNAAAALFTKYIIVYFCFYRVIDTPEKGRTFLLAHLAGCLYLGYLAFTHQGGGRLDGVGGPGIDDSNTLGMHVATAAIAGLALMVMEKKYWLGFCALATGAALNTLVATGSRGAFLALVCGGMTLVYLHAKQYRKKFLALSTVGVLAFGAVASQSFWARMDTLNAVVDKDQTMEDSAESRIVIAQAQLEMAKHYPLGNGHRGTEALSAQYLDKHWLTNSGARSSHNTFLTCLVEQGIPGALLYLSYIVWGYNSMRRIKPLLNSEDTQVMGMYAAAAAAGLVVVLVGGIFADFLKVEIQIWLAAMLASLLQLHAVQSKAVQPVSKKYLSDGKLGLRQRLGSKV